MDLDAAEFDGPQSRDAALRCAAVVVVDGGLFAPQRAQSFLGTAPLVAAVDRCRGAFGQRAVLLQKRRGRARSLRGHHHACAVLGVADILLFLRIEEPPMRHAGTASLWDALAGPFRHRDFRGYIFYSCFWNLAAMVGAPFISMYLLEHVGMDLFHVLLLWTFAWVGGAVLSNHLGHLAERFGHRPVLVLCTTFKSINMIGLLACPADPTIAFYVLSPIFMIDAFLNAGIAIANNGFMIKNSPRENRTMFIAAGVGFAGIVGGTASILAGAAISMTSEWSWTAFGTRYVNFHVLFAASLLLRLISAGLATRVARPVRPERTS